MRQAKPSKLRANDGFERGGSPLHAWGIVADERGRILGKMHCPSSMLADDIRIVKAFLIEIQKGKLDMAKQTETASNKANIVYLEGVIKSLKVRDDGSAFMLVDPASGDSKYIACTIYESEELTRRAGRFQTEDTIQIQGWLRAWSQKKNGEWQNNMEVRITRIANNPPERKRQQAAADTGADDDVPF